MIKILHIIDSLSGAGPTRSLISLVKYATGQNLPQEHRVITLRAESYPLALFQAKREGIMVLKKPDDETLQNEIKKADIVQLHFWNNPEIAGFLRRELPAMRLLIWFKVFGAHPPQMITSELLDYTDFALATSPLTLELPVFTLRSKGWLRDKTDFIYGLSDWSRLANLNPQPHENFNVGYVGTVNFTKMHPDFISMSAGITVPDIRFIVCGGGNEEQLKQQALDFGAGEKFEFRGYIENIKSVLEIMDVFGYPLCEDTYATSEKSIQEAMYVGVPPVVFPHGGCGDLVQHQVTGLVVNNQVEYRQAIDYLYRNPEDRRRLGENAARYARRVFDSEKAAQKMNRVYESMMTFPRRRRRRRWNRPDTLQKDLSPASFFTETLGGGAQQFHKSMTGTDWEVLLKADEEIANASPLLSEGEGGINQFRNRYPDDPYLRLWAGLVLQKRGHHQKAIKEFDTAMELGLIHWRVAWYKARSAYQMKDIDTAREALAGIVHAAPDFTKARELWGKLSGN